MGEVGLRHAAFRTRAPDPPTELLRKVHSFTSFNPPIEIVRLPHSPSEKATALFVFRYQSRPKRFRNASK
jgi:hypothetical protein